MVKLDLSYLEEITDGEPEVMREMIQLFVDETPKQIKNIKSGIDNKNWNKVRAEAHKLKPTFLYVGMTALNQKASLIEEYASKNSNQDDIGEMIMEIQEEFDEVRPLLQDKINSL